jgi:hypothetical protein
MGMKSFKQYIIKEAVLTDLINKHDDPYSFLAAAMDAISNGTLKLKERGLANARELIAAWNKVKKKKIKLKEAVEYIIEELPTKEIRASEFPNPLSARLKKIFLKKGEMDGDPSDDIVNTKAKSWGARKLQPSQSAIYLGKTLGMAVGGVKGGDLGAMVSKDKRILDGHHRWAATMLADPSAKITGIEADLGIGDLVPVLRAMGDSIGNTRRGEPAGGDVNIFKATIKDALEALTTGKNMHPKFYDKEKSVAWLESIGGKAELAARLKALQSHRPPKGAPPRIDMPVIDADKGDEKQAASMLRKGQIDVREPYAK